LIFIRQNVIGDCHPVTIENSYLSGKLESGSKKGTLLVFYVEIYSLTLW